MFVASSDESKDKLEGSGAEGDTASSSGVKRQREDDSRGRKDSKAKDPSSAPDPEEPEKFDENVFGTVTDDIFKKAEDDNTVTLDPCRL